ncbi:MAG: helix-turn-helix transcriptional regulator [Hyphomicrobiaceae bacterium]|nr:helix-turn-helix transcriptional regulator [Hyphomicrobiaceae bacterium]
MGQAGTHGFGDLFKSWREARRMSQLALAMDAEISQKHLSFIESGRAQPSREMVLRLAEHLEIPLRERNALLLAAGFAPLYLEVDLGEPALAMARRAMDIVLKGHEPYPALAVDRHWTLLAANAAVMPLVADCAPSLLAPPVNVVRLSLHPEGLSRRIRNLGEWRSHTLERLRRQHRTTRDPVIDGLIGDILAWHGRDEPRPGLGAFDVVVPLELDSGKGPLSLFGTTTVFGTAAEVTLSELTIEAFYPADAATAERLAAKD